METSELRAQTYEVLSECFKEPSAEFAEDVHSGRLREFLAEAFRRLNIEHSLDGLLLESRGVGAFEALREEYDDLFNHPFRHLVPVESVYSPAGRLMGEAAREMLALYERVGVRPPPQFAAMPDHLCLLLEFMSLLCHKSTPQVQKGVLAKHFGWLEKLKEDSLERSGSPFYLAAIDAAVAFVGHDRGLLKSGPRQGDDGLEKEDYLPASYSCSSKRPLTTLSGGER